MRQTGPADGHLDVAAAVARALAGAPARAEQAAALALETLVSQLGWDLACLWLAGDGDELRLGIAVQRPGGGLGSLLDANDAARGLAGAGLPGLVHASGACASADAASGASRAGPGLRQGVRSAFAFPALSGGRLVGVVELVNAQPQRVDGLQLLSAVLGSELGQAIERARLEALLSESEDRLRALMDNSVDAVVSTDDTGRIVAWNRQAEVLFGWSADEVVGATLASTIIPERRRPEYEARRRQLELTGMSPFIGNRVEVEALRRDGTEFPAELTVARTRSRTGPVYHAFLRDITERRRAELALRASEEQFRGLVSNIPGVVFRCSADADWPMEYISEDIEAITGYHASDFLGNCIRSFGSVIHERDRARVQAAIEAGVAGREPFIVEYRVRCADGSTRWVYEKGQPVYDGGGALRWLDGVILDITDRKDAEAERERLLAAERAAREEAEAARAQLAAQNEELLHLDRLKDEFVALVSHELRTPLTSIVGYVDLMLEEDASVLTDEHREFLDIVRRNSERLLNLVGDLLFVAQVDAGKLTLETSPVDLGRLAEDCVEGMRPRAHGRGIDLSFEASGATQVEGDPCRLAQLLDNLVSNAIKFTPEGGRVVVAVACGTDGVELAVSDTGIGISKDDQARLFERFFRTEGATRLAIQGTGLGLTIAKAIAEAHRATISVESTQGVGTEFRVRFPASLQVAGDRAA